MDRKQLSGITSHYSKTEPYPHNNYETFKTVRFWKRHWNKRSPKSAKESEKKSSNTTNHFFEICAYM